MIRAYYFHPVMLAPADWPAELDRIAALGFDTVLLAPLFEPAEGGDIFTPRDVDRLNPALADDRPADKVLAMLGEACARRGLKLFIDLVVGRVGRGSPLAERFPQAFTATPAALNVDPRRKAMRGLKASFPADGRSDGLAGFWQDRVRRWQALGIDGFRCEDPSAVPAPVWQELLESAHASTSGSVFIAWTAGLARDKAALLGRAGFDFVTSSAAWWNGRASWLLEERTDLRPHARLLGFPEDPFGQRLIERADAVDAVAAYRRALFAAAISSDALLVPMGFEYGAPARFDRLGARPGDLLRMREDAPFDLSPEIIRANELSARRAALCDLPMRSISRQTSSRQTSPVASFAFGGAVPEAVAMLNLSTSGPVETPWQTGGGAAGLGCAPASAAADQPLRAGDGRLVSTRRLAPITTPASRASADDAARSPRIVIENVKPSVDGGRFPAKRTVGDMLAVAADIFADGHEVLAARMLWQAADETDWNSIPMTHVGNDRWEAQAPLQRVGLHRFTVEAWWDMFGTFQRDLRKKFDAGLNLDLEVREGIALLDQSAATAAGPQAARLDALLRLISADQADKIALLLGEEARDSMQAADPRPFLARHMPEVPVDVDRAAARYASWYELFPRSITDDPARHGTFDDVIARLPAIRDMGFDVLYFPPIHPIGVKNRKGRNNTLTPGADDPGSPYAIGSKDGGHEAIHPQLGDKAAFRRLVEAARGHGLEIALDFAIQCSPDHPWLEEHPDWFDWRPDGTIKYAENPPKKYQDIVNVDFYAQGAVPGLWTALRDVVQGWVDQGVLTFRVDNPHTKPFPFWEWLIADIRARNPDVIFLAEAFTRPKVMYRLGKVGFAQSYTYFTWRNTKREMAQYLEELNALPARDIYRPHFFVNTPDINPIFLHSSGRPGFLIRAALGATLSGLFGVYSGFELCESEPVAPGKEEYLDSEKYEIKPRDWQAPGNIVAEITRLNAIRRAHPALQTHLGVSFLPASGDDILFFSKGDAADGELILVAVNLDPHNAHEAAIELPLWRLGLPDHASVGMEDLMSGQRFTFTGKHQTLRLDPHAAPFVVWRMIS